MLGFGTVRKSKTCILKKKKSRVSIHSGKSYDSTLYKKSTARARAWEKKKAFIAFLFYFLIRRCTLQLNSGRYISSVVLRWKYNFKRWGGGVGEEGEYGGTTPLEVHNDPLQSLHLFQVAQSARPLNLVVTALLFPSFFSFPFSREIHKVSVYCTASKSKHFKNAVIFFTAE